MSMYIIYLIVKWVLMFSFYFIIFVTACKPASIIFYKEFTAERFERIEGPYSKNYFIIIYRNENRER